MQLRTAVFPFLFLVASSCEAGTFRDLIKEMKSAEVDVWPALVSKIIGFSGDQTTYMKGYEFSETADGKERVCRLVLKGGKPASLVFFEYEVDSQALTTRMCTYRTTLNGTLQRAVLTFGKIDSAGEAVRGSALDQELDVSDKKIKADFRKEMDFWLKGMHRAAKPRSTDSSIQPLAGSK